MTAMDNGQVTIDNETQGVGRAGLGLPTCPNCGYEEEEWAHGHEGHEERLECSECGEPYCCTMFSEVTFTCRRIDA